MTNDAVCPDLLVDQELLTAQLLSKHLILREQVVDDLLLLAVDPASQDDQVELPGLKNKIHQCAS